MINETVTPTASVSAARQSLLEKRLKQALQAAGQGQTIPKCPRKGQAALSFAQQRLWFLDQLAPGIPVYNVWEALRLKGRLNVAALEQSFAEIIRRHEALRTVFCAVDGQPVQIISPVTSFKLAIVDMTHLPMLEREGEIHRLAISESRRSFDLSRDLMLRATLVVVGNDDHVLLVTMHHIASDGWSLGILYQELSTLYTAFLRNERSPLAELTIQYPDYAVWQRENLQGAMVDQQMAYWKKQLSGAPEFLELPTDRPRPSVQTFRGKQQTLGLSPILSSQLKAISRSEGSTLFMTLLSAFNVLLHRYTRQTDILVGSPIAGRTQMETEQLIGFFINTLVLRTDLSGNPTFRELLRRVRKSTLEAYTHQELPFDKLVMELKPERSSSHTPFFQTMFVLQNAPAQILRLAGLTITRMDVDNGTAKFDLTMSVTDTEAGMYAGLEYNTDLFDDATISRMLGHFRSLLEAIAANPDQNVGQLPLISAQERQQVVVEWNLTQRPFPGEIALAQLFEQQVARSPHAVAVVDVRGHVSYQELNERANRLARHLETHGIRPGARVGVYLRRNADIVSAFLAIIKAGAAYVPLDRSYPQDRVAFMIEDSGVEVIITHADLKPELPPHGARCVCLDEDTGKIAAQAADNLPIAGSGELVAYVIYTSGSTGKPKGSAIPHRAISRLVLNTDYVQLGPDDVVAQASNCSFDAATFEIWGALLNGSTLVIFSKETMLDPQLLVAALKRQQVSTIFLTTALFNFLAREVPGAFSTLKQVLFGGEAVDPKWVRHVLKHSPPRRLLHVYGPTETTTFATCHEVRSVGQEATTIPIGRPIANTQAYVLDEYLQPVPVGVPGELFIGGPGVGQGYYNKPEATAARFVPNPFDSSAPGIMYKTGDLVRYLPDGNIEFLGRLDNQVKIRGFRIELEEIESRISQYPAVKQCAVLVRQDGSGQKRLVAYVVTSPEQAAAVGELRQFLQRSLPEFMVPGAFVRLDEMPLNANGKIDRRALKEPEDTQGHATVAYIPPKTKLEEQLVAIWETVLGVKRVGVRDNFFELGGHSLLAVQLVAHLEKSLNKRISVSNIFQAPTIERLASLLTTGELTAVKESSVVEIQPRGDKPPIFFVHGVGGGMFWGYTNLARYLGPDQPVYALKSRGMEGDEEFTRIEDMAAQYVADLRAFQPSGPYCIGGYCFGGIVAFEMAQQLVAQGERVSMLALINCGPPNSSYAEFRWTPGVILKFLQNLYFWVGNSLRWTREERASFIRWKWRTLRKRLFGVSAAPITGKVSPGHDIETIVDLSLYPDEQRKLWETHVRALLNYFPKSYSGEVTLLRSRGHQLLCSYDPLYGWGSLAKGGVTVKVFPAPHERILEEPYVKALAHELKGCLKKVQAEAAPELEMAALCS